MEEQINFFICGININQSVSLGYLKFFFKTKKKLFT